MSERIKCNKCGLIYRDKASIDIAKAQADAWKDLCERDGVQVTGLVPCPDVSCSGEMVLNE